MRARNGAGPAIGGDGRSGARKSVGPEKRDEHSSKPSPPKIQVREFGALRIEHAETECAAQEQALHEHGFVLITEQYWRRIALADDGWRAWAPSHELRGTVAAKGARRRVPPQNRKALNMQINETEELVDAAVARQRALQPPLPDGRAGVALGRRRIDDARRYADAMRAKFQRGASHA